MPRKRNRIVRYALQNRSLPSRNRRRVGQSLILLSVFMFFVFLINFATITGTDRKFGQNLSEGAQSVHQQEITVQARRGTIYDRLGKPIAEDSTTYTIYAVIDKDYVSANNEPLFVQESQFDKVADILKERLGFEKDYVIGQLKLPNLNQIYFGPLGKNISYGTMIDIQTDADKAGIKGIAFDTSPGRLYPNGDFASFFIGLAQLKDNEDGSQSLSGRSGLENALDDILSGQDGKIIYEKDSKGRILPGTENVQAQTVDGQDVYTTLSAELQRSLESNMDVFDEKTKGVYANATLMSAKTGEILATTQRPSFDPDTKEGLNDKNLVWRSMLFQDQIEPGSTMKVMTLASAIDSGVFNTTTTYYNDEYTIADATIKDWGINSGARDAEYLNYAQGFALSSNIGMTRLEQSMGDDKWLNYLSKFRFGYPTRFGMMDEAGGMLPEDNIVSIAMSSFGQGINATQVQMLRAFSAIGNNGAMLEPKFVSALYDPNANSVRLSQPEVAGHPVSEKAAEETRKYMITVGTDPYYGTLYSRSAGGAVIQVYGYNVAVKSGTAQIPKPGGGGYMEGPNDYINSVVAMVPAEDPEFIMYVTLQQPQSFSILSWQDIVNPVLKEAMLLKDSLNLTAASPNLVGIAQETTYSLDKVIGQVPGPTADELRRNLVQPIVLGNGPEIIKASFKKGENLASNQQVLLLTSNFSEVPDMYGWTKENVDLFSKWLDIDIVYEGVGARAIKQSVKTGTGLDKTKKITITLGD
ncbi:penicillin-binding protein [Streptococcus sp. X16XC17]|uniref:penicillin-binding protein PBP2X n=1 Tax=unclassified Streptococcus TaxID=2608887 RepID=UPI00066FCE3C|nr:MULTISPECIES: penicillin-binding protein PBP2X [unclassified Streptococcus]TCD46020.1 penicillin-binding protein [Streptococcus sp. X16XC17]